MKNMEEFIKERNEALFSLDRKKIENYMQKYCPDKPSNDIVFWAGVYKSICNIKDAPEDLVIKAKIWLHNHGMSEKVIL